MGAGRVAATPGRGSMLFRELNRRMLDGSGTGVARNPYPLIDQGPIVLMIENYRSGLLWSVMRRCPYVVTGLRRAGFTNGWL